MIRYGSVCSGVEAASLAWKPLGWTPAWFSEIDPVASGVLAYHWPDVPNLGDMLELDAARCADIDVLVGGTPCQSFSVAGLRKGLDDERGNLTLSFVRLAETIDAVRRERGQPPITIVWENVPGVFSNSDNPFGCFLGALAGEDDPLEPPGEGWSNAGCVLGPERTIAWRVLNAQYFGVPQRRRRVFVVASAREGFDPREVLFESEGLRRDTQTSGEARKEAPGDVAGSLGGGSGARGWCNDLDRSGAFIPILEAGARTGKSTTDKRAGIGIGKPGDPMYTLQAGKQHAVAVAMRGRDGGATCEIGGEVANALRSADGGGSKPFVLAEVVPTLRAGGNQTGGDRPPGTDVDTVESLQVVSVAENQRAEVVTSKVIPSLSTPGGKPGMGYPCIAFNARQDPVVEKNITGPLDGNGYSNGITTGFRVRRLLPVECERLMGMKDGHTARTADKELADGPRYKLIGNSMAVPVMAWIGQRIRRAL